MKKTYKKPVAVIESFELSQHIAACAQPIKNKNSAIKEGCSADVPNLGITGLFYTALDNDICVVDGEDMYCYTKGGSEAFVFSS